MHESSLIKNYPGIDRLLYFFMTFGVGIVSGFANVITGNPNSPLASTVALIGLFIVMAANILRLSNIGMSQWWALLVFVPFANIWLGFRCQTAQTGWIETRRLDRTGVRIAVIYVCVFVLLVAAVAVALYIDPEALNLLTKPPAAG